MTVSFTPGHCHDQPPERNISYLPFARTACRTELAKSYTIELEVRKDHFQQATLLCEAGGKPFFFMACES
jgi:hypothetical protein